MMKMIASLARANDQTTFAAHPVLNWVPDSYQCSSTAANGKWSRLYYVAPRLGGALTTHRPYGLCVMGYSYSYLSKSVYNI